MQVWPQNSFGWCIGWHWEGHPQLRGSFQDKIPRAVGQACLPSRRLWKVLDVRRRHENSTVLVLRFGFSSNLFLNRQICADKYSVVRSYRWSNHLVLTGCTRMPGKGSKFCYEHKVLNKVLWRWWTKISGRGLSLPFGNRVDSRNGEGADWNSKPGVCKGS